MTKRTTIKGLVGLTTTLLVFSLLVATGIGVAVASPSVSVDPATTTGLSTGSTFDIDVLVDSDGDVLRCAEVELHYDTNVLQVNGVDDGNLFSPSMVICDYSTSGVVEYTMIDTGGAPYAAAAGTLMTVHFEVKATAPDGKSDLTLPVVVLKDGNKDVIAGVGVTGGEVTVGSSTTQATVKVSPEETTNVCPGSTFDIDVLVDSDGDVLRCAEVELHYDTNVLQVNGVDDGNLFSPSMVICDYSTSGVVEYTMIDTGGAPYAAAAGTLMTVHFEVKATAPDGKSDLTLPVVVLKDGNKDVIAGVGVTDGTVEVSSLNTYYGDADGDSYGDPANTTEAESAPAGYVEDNTDCDDTDAAVNPGATEVCDDGIDNDCDGDVDCADSDCIVDADEDGYNALPCGDDCDDANAAVNPGATEICDGIDNNCDGQIDEGCCACDFCLDLDAGWNLVSVPRMLDGPTDAATVFNLSATELCEYYDGCAGGWSTAIPSAMQVTPGRGYMVAKASAETRCLDFDDSGTAIPPSQQLCKDDWNMIGFPSLDSMSVAEFGTVTALNGKFTMVWQWNSGWECVSPPDSNTMIPGKGYLLWMTADGVMPGMIA